MKKILIILILSIVLIAGCITQKDESLIKKSSLAKDVPIYESGYKNITFEPTKKVYEWWEEIYWTILIPQNISQPLLIPAGKKCIRYLPFEIYSENGTLIKDVNFKCDDYTISSLFRDPLNDMWQLYQLFPDENFILRRGIEPDNYVGILNFKDFKIKSGIFELRERPKNLKRPVQDEYLKKCVNESLSMGSIKNQFISVGSSLDVIEKYDVLAITPDDSYNLVLVDKKDQFDWYCEFKRDSNISYVDFVRIMSVNV